MKVIITCGPSFEPIDGMRRITNASTGELGLMLAQTFVAVGHEVTVLKGEMATSMQPCGTGDVVPFSTNDDLLDKLAGRSADAIFHAAALCDFRLKEARSADGEVIRAAKIPTRGGEVTLTLEPTTKVLPRLRALFPLARIIGWKFEPAGAREDIVGKAMLQMLECGTDGCVVNGPGWGAGFGFIRPDGSAQTIDGRPALCGFLTAL